MSEVPTSSTAGSSASATTTATTTASTKAGPMPAGQPRSTAATSLALLALVGMAGGGYLLWQQQQRLQTLQSAYADLATTAQTLQSVQSQQQTAAEQLSNLSTRQQGTEQGLQETRNAQQQLLNGQQQLQLSVQQQVQSASVAVAEQSAKLAALTQQVSSIESLFNNSGAQAQRQQLLADVSGMLQLADLRLQLAQDVDAAVLLLRSADSLLARSSEAALLSLRGQVSAALQQLAALPSIDSAALYQRLQKLNDMQQGLAPIAANGVADFAVDAQANTVSANASWWQRLRQFIGQYFVVTRRDTAVTPLFTPEQRWLIHKGLELQLRQAQLAVLENQQTTFAAALNDALQTVQTQLQGSEQASIVAELQVLQSVQLRPALPSLAGLVATVQALQSGAFVPVVSAPTMPTSATPAPLPETPAPASVTP